FETERGTPFTTDAVNRLIKRIGERAGFPFKIHVHMLRHACGYALANAGHEHAGNSGLARPSCHPDSRPLPPVNELKESPLYPRKRTWTLANPTCAPRWPRAARDSSHVGLFKISREQLTAHKRFSLEGPLSGAFGYGNAPQSRFFPRANQPM